MRAVTEDTAPEATERPRRRRRGRRVLGAFLALVLILVGTVAGWAFYLNHQLGDITHFPLELGAGTDAGATPRPARVDGEALNLLLVGVDDGQGADLDEMLTSGDWQPGVFRSDAIMLLHLAADRRSAQVVSIPRDSYVPIAGQGTTKINAAFSYGGPSLLARTVEDLTGVYVDHVAVVDFSGFEELTTILGGVDVYVPQTVTDPARGITWDAGLHHVEGEEALAYVRQRKGLLRGDLDRVQRQQNFLRAVAEKLTDAGVLANPFRVTSLVDQLSDVLAVDDGLDSGTLRSLALSSRHLRTANLRFATVPVTGTPTIDGASVVTLDVEGVRDMLGAVARDDYDSWRASHEVDELPGADGVD